MMQLLIKNNNLVPGLFSSRQYTKLNNADLPWYCSKNCNKFLDFITFDYNLVPQLNCFAVRNSLDYSKNPPTYKRGVIRVSYDDSKPNLESLDVENRIIFKTLVKFLQKNNITTEAFAYDTLGQIDDAKMALIKKIESCVKRNKGPIDIIANSLEVIAILPQMNATVKDLPMILKSIDPSNLAKRYDLYKNVFAHLEEPKVNTVSFHGSGCKTIKAYNLITNIHDYVLGDGIVPTESLMWYTSWSNDIFYRTSKVFRSDHDNILQDKNYLNKVLSIINMEIKRPQAKTKISSGKKIAGSCGL
ncbi:hypothetical protein A3Q56_06121 [Intoshia linei]|uniref:Uncharacterized protein n=1 Tax=Intoshia linei TaxID=1819745 RepID=A0A177AY87_9BILA|nr:hypothetical protein A3Q56_06121 [Intoshia linei]